MWTRRQMYCGVSFYARYYPLRIRLVKYVSVYAQDQSLACLLKTVCEMKLSRITQSWTGPILIAFMVDVNRTGEKAGLGLRAQVGSAEGLHGG